MRLTIISLWLVLAVATALPCTAEDSAGRIAYVCLQNSQPRACLMDPDGSNQMTIGPTLSNLSTVAWSPDSAKIAFVSSGSTSEISIMDAGGSHVIQITNLGLSLFPPLHPRFSPDGSKIVFAAPTNLPQDAFYQLLTIPSAGGSPTQLTSGSGQHSMPAWSPDGTRILFNTGSALFSVNPSGGAATQIASGLHMWPAWSPDGSKIAYADFSGLFIMNSDGSNVRLVANAPTVKPSWSPDGKQIIFGNAVNQPISIVNADGTGLHSIPGVTGNFPDWGSAKAPIILVPGFLGSRIVCGAQELWPNMPFPNFLDMRLASDGISNLAGTCGAQVGAILDTALGSNVYKPALDFLNQIAPGRNYNFPWDWRTTPASTLALLDAYIDSVRSANNGAKVVLMAHSMGGLLTRLYIDDPTHAAKVARLLTIGTPYWGSPKALFPLAAGIETPALSSLDGIVLNSDLKAWAVNAFGLYFLYPSANYGPWLTVTSHGPSPLDQAGLLDFVGNTLGGNASLLTQALNEHARTLDSFKTNGVKYRAVVGTGINTVGKVTIDTPTFSQNIVDADLLYFSGDSTVPVRSAQGSPGGSTSADAVPISYVCGVPHVDLPGDPTVTGAIKGFLLSGADIQGLTTPCPSSGFEIKRITLLTGASLPANEPLRAAASEGLPAAATMSLEDARIAGLIDVFDFSSGTTIVTDSIRPVSFSLPAGTFQLLVTPLQDGIKGNPVTYGPLTGNITISADTTLTVFQNGLVVQPGASDTIPPSTAGTVSPTPVSGWNNSNVAVNLNASDNAGGSGVRRITYSATGAQTIASTVVNGSSASFSVTASGVTTVSFFAEDNAGNVETAKSLTVKIDRAAPAISCASPAATWSPANVTISCTAIDSGGSGLANAADASFSLATTVPEGTETANALTGARNLCDVAGNCSTAGPVSGNKVDKKAPSITITSPQNNAVYVLNQAAAASYDCSDGGSGVATCNGPVPSGGNIATAVVGPKTFPVTSADQVGNAASASASYQIRYAATGSCNGDPAHQILPPIAAGGTSVFKQGSTVPAKFRVCDANGVSVGTAGVVSGFSIVGTIDGTVVNSVNATVDSNTPDTAFRWDANAQQWIFNITTQNLSAGLTYIFRIVLNDGSAIDFQFGLR